MPKPLNQFGGWLRFFQVFIWFFVVLLFISVAGFLALSLVGRIQQPWSSINMIRICSAIVLFPLILIIAIKIRLRIPTIPTILGELLIAVTVVQIIGAAVEAIIKQKHATLLAGPIVQAIWAGIWILYFKNSKRVKAFYGANAFDGKQNYGVQQAAPPDRQ